MPGHEHPLRAPKYFEAEQCISDRKFDVGPFRGCPHCIRTLYRSLNYLRLTGRLGFGLIHEGSQGSRERKNSDGFLLHEIRPQSTRSAMHANALDQLYKTATNTQKQ